MARSWDPDSHGGRTNAAGRRSWPRPLLDRTLVRLLGVGSNRRYPDAGAQRSQQRRLLEATRRGPLQSLSDEQLQLGARVVSLAPERSPMWALAWLRFGDTQVRCTVQVKRWTADAVGVELVVGEELLRCWVWQGAVEWVESPTPPL